MKYYICKNSNIFICIEEKVVVHRLIFNKDIFIIILYLKERLYYLLIFSIIYYVYRIKKLLIFSF